MGEKVAIFNPLFHYSLLKLTIPFLEIPPWLCRRFRLALANIDALRTADAGIGVGYERNKYGKAKACRPLYHGIGERRPVSAASAPPRPVAISGRCYG
ncbi:MULTISPECIES: hypothetical protein [unclassified Ensifer]|uniref:hypothetical protein n=1 Tax=unclassified Ensifer TaxID=2633371 RepID=UPI00115F9432|nr:MULTISPECIES: hypothetical protein [unclassified Ensifer]MBD9592070.1 hypothetical protein [Ensifer sp. ENS05]